MGFILAGIGGGVQGTVSIPLGVLGLVTRARLGLALVSCLAILALGDLEGLLLEDEDWLMEEEEDGEEDGEDARERGLGPFAFALSISVAFAP